MCMCRHLLVMYLAAQARTRINNTSLLRTTVSRTTVIRLSINNRLLLQNAEPPYPFTNTLDTHRGYLSITSPTIRTIRTLLLLTLLLETPQRSVHSRSTNTRLPVPAVANREQIGSVGWTTSRCTMVQVSSSSINSSFFFYLATGLALRRCLPPDGLVMGSLNDQLSMFTHIIDTTCKCCIYSSGLFPCWPAVSTCFLALYLCSRTRIANE